MNANKSTAVKLAAIVLKQARADWAEYREACDEAYRAGYRPHYCRHGVNLWTDYDPMCGACEDGRGYWDYPTECQDALDTAKRAIAECDRRQELTRPVTRDPKLPGTIAADLLTWILAPMTAITRN
jgi:hypothetical protein